MPAMTNYLTNKVYDHVLRNTAYTSPTTVYVGLYTTTTTAAGGGTECTGTGYARVAVTMGAPSNGDGSNSAEVDYGTGNADWGTISHIAVLDASSAGNMLYYGALTVSKAITADPVKIPIGDLDITHA